MIETPVRGSDVDGFAGRGGGRFHDRFAEGRVGVDRLVDLFDGGLQLHGQAVFGDQLGGLAADDVGAVDFAGLCVGDDLHEAIALGGGDGLAGGGEGELADIDVEFLFLGGLFREAGAADLGLAIGAAGEVFHAPGLAVAEHAVDRVDRLEGGD